MDAPDFFSVREKVDEQKDDDSTVDGDDRVFIECEECGGDRFNVLMTNPFYGNCLDCQHVLLYPKFNIVDKKLMQYDYPDDPGKAVYDYGAPKKTTLRDFL